MKQSRINSSQRLVLLVTVFSLCLAGKAAAQTWNGGGGAPYDFTVGANWSTGVAPTSGAAITFAGSVGLTPFNNEASSFLEGNITFAAGSGAFIIGSTSRGLKFKGTLADQNTTTTETIATGAITSTLDQAGQKITVSSGGTLVFDSPLQGNGFAYTVESGGGNGGTFVLAANSNSDAGITVAQSTMLVVSGSDVESGPMSVGSGSTIGGGAAGASTEGGTITITGANAFTASSGAIIAAGGISGNATPGLTISAAGNTFGAGFLTVSGAAFNFNLGTSNSASTLSLASSFANEVSGLSGNTINLTDTTSGSLSPGLYTLIQSDDSATNPFSGLTPGTLAGFTLNGLSAYTGAGETVQLQLNQNASDSGDYAIQVDLIAIPEPGTWGMIFLGFGLLCSVQRLRKLQVGT